MQLSRQPPFLQGLSQISSLLWSCLHSSSSCLPSQTLGIHGSLLLSDLSLTLGLIHFFLFNVGVSYYQNAKSLRAEMLSWSFVVFRIVWCIKWVFEMILLNNWSSGFRFPDLRQENSAQMWVEVQMNRGKMLEASWARPWTSVCSPWWGGEQSGRLDKLSSPRDVRPWVQCFPWPSDQGQLHWRSSRGPPWRVKPVKEVRLSRKTLSQTIQVSRSSTFTEPVLQWT